MPYATVPTEAIERMSEVSGNAFKLFVYFCDRADKAGECYPSLARIAQDCGWGKGHASEYRAALVKASWITLNGETVTLLIWASRSQKRNKRASKLPSKPFPKRERKTTKKAAEIVPETGTPSVPEMGTKGRPNRSQNGNKSFPKPEQTVPEMGISLITNETKNETNERNQQRVAASAVNPARKSKSKSNPAAEPWYGLFVARYRAHYGCPYGKKTADFVQLDARLKADPGWMTEERWMQAVENYFATTGIGNHTLADLCTRFGGFFLGPLNQYGGRSVDPGNGINRVNQQKAPEPELEFRAAKRI